MQNYTPLTDSEIEEIRTLVNEETKIVGVEGCGRLRIKQATLTPEMKEVFGAVIATIDQLKSK